MLKWCKLLTLLTGGDHLVVQPCELHMKEIKFTLHYMGSGNYHNFKGFSLEGTTIATKYFPCRHRSGSHYIHNGSESYLKRFLWDLLQMIQVCCHGLHDAFWVCWRNNIMETGESPNAYSRPVFYHHMYIKFCYVLSIKHNTLNFQGPKLNEAE